MVAAASATLGRNTAFALAALFAWMAVIEGVIRGTPTRVGRYLWAENIATVVPWAQMKSVQFTRSPLLALGTIVVYAVVIIGVATLVFRTARHLRCGLTAASRSRDGPPTGAGLNA